MFSPLIYFFTFHQSKRSLQCFFPFFSVTILWGDYRTVDSASMNDSHFWNFTKIELNLGILFLLKLTLNQFFFLYNCSNKQKSCSNSINALNLFQTKNRKKNKRLSIIFLKKARKALMVFFLVSFFYCSIRHFLKIKVVNEKGRLRRGKGKYGIYWLLRAKFAVIFLKLLNKSD